MTYNTYQLNWSYESHNIRTTNDFFKCFFKSFTVLVSAHGLVQSVPAGHYMIDSIFVLDSNFPGYEGRLPEEAHGENDTFLYLPRMALS